MTTPINNMTDTWTDGGVVYSSITMTITDTASAAGSKLINISASSGGSFSVSKEGHIAFSGHLDFTPGSAPAWEEGLLYYDEDEKALSYYNEESEITINLGQENVLRVKNNTGGQIDNGTVVYISGADAGIPEISKSVATAQSPRVVGIATHDIEDGTIGYATTFGVVRSIDTSAFSAGDTLYVSSSVAGEIVNVAPTYPVRSIQIGTCIVAAVDGKIYVEIDSDSSAVAVVKSYTFAARSASSGVRYQAGFYTASATDANLTNAAPTVTHGDANAGYAAHAFCVSGGNGSTDGSDLVLTVSGTSITDAGTRTPADSEIVVIAATTSPLNTYTETSKKWLGTVTYTLTSTGGSVFSYDFNYGYAKYEDFNNVDVTLRGLECVGLCDTSDTGFNIQLYVHNDTGWTYSAAAFVAGNTPIKDMNVTYATENNIVGGEPFAYKFTGLTDDIAGADSEGLVIKITTTTNNAIAYLDSHLTVTVP